jgi:hypothetical protein
MNRRVLVVEDDPFQRLQFDAMMEKLSARHATPIRTELAANLEEAHAALRGGPFDLVLADFDLGNGQTSLELRDRCGPARFVLTSGKTWGEIFREDGPPPGERRYLSKLTTLAGYLRGLEACLFDAGSEAAARERRRDERAQAAIIGTLLSPFLILAALVWLLPQPLAPGGPAKGELNDFPLIRSLQSATMQAQFRRMVCGGLTPQLGLKCCQTATIPSEFGKSSGAG